MDDGLRVTLLDAFQVSRGDAVLPVPGARLQALVVRLALAGGRAVEPSALIDAIWAESPPADPTHALQALVSRLRRTAAVAVVTGGYRLAIDDVDALRFEELAASGRDRLRAGDVTAAAAVLGEAAALWGEHPGVEPAVVAVVAPAVATRLAHVSVEAATDLAAAELALGRADAAAARLTALLAVQPTHEHAAALLMDALAVQGRQAEALASYERIREALADTLGADPGAALRDRHLRLLRADDPAPAPPPSTLPAPLTSFIGREDDLARISSLLADGRLVTVVGPGGAGKTRLAIEAARRDSHAWFVDLSSVTEPTKVGAAVLAAIGLRGSALFSPGAARTEIEVLADQLNGRESLLVVDNCEHLIDAVAHLVSALLTRCATLRVLATSREPLAVDGEALVPLGPLPLPSSDADVTAAPSVRLFVERAAAVRPGFRVTAGNRAQVLRIVRDLDGLPLALELAAARLRTLSLDDLAAGLSDRFRLLSTGSRTAFPRHRTLRAVIAWSWDLLSPAARDVAARISVLPGGITPASAAAVCLDDVRELLADLVDRSLLQLVPDSGRYRMLETIREYGQENVGAEVRDLAASYFADLVARSDPLLRGASQLDALHVLRAEHDNVLFALRHLCDSGDAERAIGLAVDLTWYWTLLGRFRDAIYWLGETVAVPGPSALRDVAEAMMRHTAATQSALAKQPPGGQLSAELPGFGGALIALRQAFLEDNSAYVQQVIDDPDRWLAGLAHLYRARAEENQGLLDRVRSDVTHALECFGTAGDRWGLASALPLRAQLRQYDGDLDGALADLLEAKRLAREFGSLSLSDEIFVDFRLIDLHLRLGDTAVAAVLIAATRSRVQRAPSPENVLLLDTREAGFQVRLGDLARASQLVESAEAALSTPNVFDRDHGQALVNTVRAALCLALGDGPGASSALARAYAGAVGSMDMPVVASVAVTAAGLSALHGRHYDVALVLGAAARLRGAHDPTDPQVQALSRHARAALGAEAFDAAYDQGWHLSTSEALRTTDTAFRTLQSLDFSSRPRRKV
ncbi:BTAD domain-containing putative transcriptional regulator [Kutzneria chonburiensis]|uniref:BTAD domain-containing putative transcriptional regulator n=1 Tax=Kutzneria chonburiensis TaxID=1483604 RepID=A0ABV6NA42_9PSEU|nr:BTAD domain-containing putative transcriptional regulator [Kutzneria chonburiensis]